MGGRQYFIGGEFMRFEIVPLETVFYQCVYTGGKNRQLLHVSVIFRESNPAFSALINYVNMTIALS